MDVKAKIEEVVSRLTKDGDLAANFKSDPVKTIEKVLGVDLPDDVVSKIVDGVKDKLALDKLGDAAGGLKDKVKDLLKK